jgi:protein-histidine pros-kinase
VNDLAQLLFDETPNALIGLSTEGRILFWNRGAEATFGYTTKQAVGRSFYELIVRKDRLEEEKKIFRRTIRCGFATHESTRRKKDGSLVGVTFSSKVIRNRQGRIRFVLQSEQDISSLKALRPAARETTDMKAR